MFNVIQHYYHWLHGQWPSGTVEALPDIEEDGKTNVQGVFVAGDLTGIPLLKFATHSGARSVRRSLDEIEKCAGNKADHQLVIIGGGVSGYAAALEAKKNNLNFTLIEADRAFSTIENFPKGKPIFTYPTSMTPDSELSINEKINQKENLLEELKSQVDQVDIPTVHGNAERISRSNNVLNIYLESGETITANAVVVCIGRSGKYRTLGVPGETLDKVVNRLHDPKVYAGKQLLIVGGGDSALEAAVACADAGTNVTLSYRRSDFSKAKPENIEQVKLRAEAGSISLQLNSQVTSIEEGVVHLVKEGEHKSIANDVVLTAIGREAPLDFFRKSKINLKGESSLKGWIAFIIFFVAMIALYDWKNFGFLNSFWSGFVYPDQMPAALAGINGWWESQVNDRSTLIGTIATSMKSRSFYYTLLYTSCIGYFGWQRIRRRKTPYVTVQTLTLFFVQAIPLFILPEIILPLAGYNGAYDSGWLQSVANNLFPSYISAQELAAQQWPEWGHPRAYWHAYGLILAWPLNVYNVFTPNPMAGWLIISAIQTFIIIPFLIFKYGKGAYCGWICSCGALAETMGDTLRHKMPHGPKWNKVNMIGQVFLWTAVVLLMIRIGGWIFPESWMNTSFDLLLKGENSDYQLVNPVSWKWMVDVLAGGILGVGLYFKYSGRVWCRFACPLAALMHIYARFSRFRIFSDKSKCISCNVCTSVCHQGIDIMSFANKGKPMEDPQCVRCSACVQSCPTGVLSFGQIDKKTGNVIATDALAASRVQMVEPVNAAKAS